jgi:hypothetical protein
MRGVPARRLWPFRLAIGAPGAGQGGQDHLVPRGIADVAAGTGCGR